MVNQEGFCEELRRRNEPLWVALRHHPFVQGIGDGSLDPEMFRFYLKQDHLYLIEFARILAVGAARARAVNDLYFFFQLMKDTIEMEMESLRRTCSELGISSRELEITEPGLGTVAYASHLLRTCYEGGPEDIMAALLPCEAGYAELGRQLKKQGLPENRHYRNWIQCYSSQEFLRVASRCEEFLDLSARGASAEVKERWHHLYRISLRFEIIFFDASWKQELWPAIPTEE
jgi:thiaminase/transcriptional activator TenA